MATVIGKLAAPGGKYIKDGEEKTRWTYHGIVLQTDNGIRVKLESVPVGSDFEGWFSVFEDKPKPQTRDVPATGSEEPF